MPRIVVVTGSSGGIGRATAIAFGARGDTSYWSPAARKDWPARPRRSSGPEAPPS
jgi:NAD(P)-dependent dehydrogenase (short-subunit alcohol dehydrogenase family)